MKLFRLVGEKELKLVRESGFKKFPPRLPAQPIFYPVLTKKYAIEIASRWNTQDSNSGYKGYVLEFAIEDAYISKFQSHRVGANYHQEFWIPAEELENFNQHIIGTICVIEEFE